MIILLVSGGGASTTPCDFESWLGLRLGLGLRLRLGLGLRLGLEYGISSKGCFHHIFPFHAICFEYQENFCILPDGCGVF